MPNFQNVAYNGILDVKLRTFTTTYIPITSPWNFNTNNQEPVDFGGFIRDNLPVAFRMRVFDLRAGVSSFEAGNFTGAVQNNGSFGEIIYNREKLQGWVYGASLVLRGMTVDYNWRLNGSGTSFQTLDMRTNLFLPSGIANTGTSAAGMGRNFLCTLGLYNSYLVNLSQNMAIYQGNAAAITNPTPIVFSTGAFNVHSMLPVSGLDRIWCNLNSFVPGERMLVTLCGGVVGTGVVRYQPVVQEPPNSNVSFNTFFNQDRPLLQVTSYGWLEMVKSTAIIDGRTLNGYGVLLAPDFSSYRIINIIPIDTNALTWNTAPIGSVSGKFDESGALWLKKSNDQNTLFISAVTGGRLLPIFPPVALPPPPPDTEEPMLPYRESGAAS